MRGLTWDVVERAGKGKRHPFEVFMLLLSFTSGLTVVLGGVEVNAVSEAVPSWAEFIWGAILLGGSGIALVGLWWPERITGIITEQIGLIMVGFATVFYAACILKYAGFSRGAVAVGYIIGFGTSCIWRWAQLEKLIRTLRDIESGEVL